MIWKAPTHDPGKPLRDALPAAGWIEAAAIISARHRLPDPGLSLFATGSDVVVGGAGHVVKLTAPRWVEEILNEHRTLAHVAGRLPVATPEPLAIGQLDGWPYVVMSRVGGVPLSRVWPGLDAADRLHLARALGELVAALRAVPWPSGDSDWARFLAAREAGVIAQHRSAGAPEPWLDRIRPFLATCERPDRDLVFLHTELLGEHILVEQRAGQWRPAALIDFADSRVGHPDYEYAALIEFVFQGSPGCLRACLASSGWTDAELDPAGSRRLAAWGLLHRFARLPRALAAVGPPEPVDFDELVDRLYAL